MNSAPDGRGVPAQGPRRETTMGGQRVGADPVSEAGTSNSTVDAQDRNAAGVVDPELLATVLARGDDVDAVYLSDAPGETHVWTVLKTWNDAALDAVFERELELYDCFGKRLASVEFHVLTRESADNVRMGRRVFQRVG